ncbi:MAG: type IV pilus twitching motility protein PilT, partial [Candidatus Sumerlaeia bacterium]
MDIVTLLREAVSHKASDLHLCSAAPPVLRIDGRLRGLNAPPLTRDELRDMIYSLLNDYQREKFESEWELDCSIDVRKVGRFRVNVHRQKGNIEAAFRVVQEHILSLRQLGLPDTIADMCRKESGLILVTGPTGSGKTTTMASMIDTINAVRPCMIVTIEDPIEFIHRHKRAIIKQREVLTDTKSFTAALRHALRQDPDVISIGEMRDLETIRTALTAAETGHLVIATLHTPDVTQTIDRIIDVFPPYQQDQVRLQLAQCLTAILCQQLLPIPGDKGRVLAIEILIATSAVRQIIRSKKLEQIMTVLQTSTEGGMVSMDKSLKNLYQQGLISYDDAINKCKHP